MRVIPFGDLQFYDSFCQRLPDSACPGPGLRNTGATQSLQKNISCLSSPSEDTALMDGLHFEELLAFAADVLFAVLVVNFRQIEF